MTHSGGMSIIQKSAQLDRILADHAPLLVAYSGGVDSAYLLAQARNVLGKNGVTAAIADSASLPRKSLQAALALAESLDSKVVVLETNELDDPDYATNPPNRCYFCKAELFRRMDDYAVAGGYKALAYGENADDAEMVRPGAQAAREFMVLAPLRDAGLTKSEIRQLSRDLGLPTADAPAQPCLSSRIPWGTPVDAESLAMVERAEEAVRALGFTIFRVRHIVNGGDDAKARLLVAPEEMHKLNGLDEKLSSAMFEAGYSSLEIDEKGYQPPARVSTPANGANR